MSGEIVVVLYHQVDDVDTAVAAYTTTSEKMAGTPGLLGNQLLQAVDDERRFTVVSTWTDWAAFTEWEGGPEHQAQTAPMRPHRAPGRSREFELYRVVKSY